MSAGARFRVLVHALDKVPPPKVAEAVRVVCISDTHGATPPVPMGDVLIHAGDFTRTGRLEEVMDFVSWLNLLPHEHKVVVAGNHETTLDETYYTPTVARRMGHRTPYDPRACRAALLSARGTTYLEHSYAVVAGVRFWGSPTTPEFCDWAFNAERGPKIQRVWEDISEEVDVLVTHGPPKGHGSKCRDGNDAGCADLLARVDVVRPALHVFGHIHEGYGVTRNDHTVFINASTCTRQYRPTNRPIVVDLVTTLDRPRVPMS